VVSDVADEIRLGDAPLASDTLSLLLTDRSALIGLLPVPPVLLLLPFMMLCSTLCRLLLVLLLL
jgi:hypothetical protein